ncbi:MAG: sulfatase [Halobacteriaceae archaeon]
MNVVTVFVDTLRYDHVAANRGAVDVRTPNLDRLAERSRRFHRAFAASFPTVPHRTDVMTGRYGAPFHPWAPLDCDVPTLPRRLADEGYVTQLIHDTPHLVNGGHRFDYPFHAWTPVRGGEVDRAWVTDSLGFLDNWAFDEAFDAYPRDEEAVLREGHTLARYAHTNSGRSDESEWNAARLFRTAADFLRDNADRDDFFLWLDCFDPHEPWDAPREYVREYAGGDGTVDPRSFLGYVRDDPDLPEEARAQVRAAYRAKVTFVDRWFGHFLDALEETGLADDTAVLLLGDHGTNVGRTERGFGKEAPPGQGEAHVPLFLSVPGDDGGDCDAVVQPQDVFETVMELAGGSAPGGVESHDLLAAAREGTRPRDVALTGTVVDGWAEADAGTHLCHATDGEWSLEVAADPAASTLRRLGEREAVGDDRPAVREELWAAAVDELAGRGLDDALVSWLRDEGAGDPPEAYRATDAHGAPPGWETYWQVPFEG